MKNIYLQILDHLNDDPSPVLATVVGKKGSGPQVPGSSALFGEKGLLAGTVGGGAVEGKVTRIAAERIHSKESGFLKFNLLNDITMKEEAICGGELHILVDGQPVKHEKVFREIQSSIENDRKGILITRLSNLTESGTIVSRYWLTDDNVSWIPDDILQAAEPLLSQISNSPEQFKNAEIELTVDENSMIFLEQLLPPPRLVIAGAGHIGRSLSHLGNWLGFDVTVIDDREEFANRENLPEAHHIIAKDIGEAMRELKKGANTYVVIVTRGHKDDAEALKQCIGSDLAYTGMIGSRHKIIALRDEFIKNGWATSAQWSEIHSPIGLEINSRTIEEIAVSIAAQLIMIKNSGNGKSKPCPS
ncbi:MAG TPA: XdhC family protein [Bacteroidales bacterium]|nr:XdhC family protein [Bacteroidales bacterium]